MNPDTRRALVFYAAIYSAVPTVAFAVAKLGDPADFDPARVEVLGYVVAVHAVLFAALTVWSVWRSVQETRSLARRAVLATLALGDNYGYAISSDIEERSGWRPGPGTLYPVLHALEAEGLTQSYEGEPHPETNRPRIYYRLTDNGRAAFRLLLHGGVSARRACLLLLSDGRNWLGLDLVKASGGILKRGTVYVTLARLEDEGLVEWSEMPIERGGLLLGLRIYSLTAAGRKALETA